MSRILVAVVGIWAQVLCGADANAENRELDKQLKRELTDRYYRRGDHAEGECIVGENTNDAHAIEYALVQSAMGSTKDRIIAVAALKCRLAQFEAIDGDAHRARLNPGILSLASNMRLFAIAANVLGDNQYWRAALNNERYSKELYAAPDGVYYSSSIGAQQIFPRENGWMIEALMAMYAVSGDSGFIKQGELAARWMLANRKMDGGGFRREQGELSGPLLGDTLAMGRASLALYEVTADRQWLRVSDEALSFIERTFSRPEGLAGYSSEKKVTTSEIAQMPDLIENVSLARYANAMFYYTGIAEHRAAMDRALHYVTQRNVALSNVAESNIILALDEASRTPLHITIVGPKDDANAINLFRSALAYPRIYRRLEWLDYREGPLMNSDITYPRLNRAAAYVCTERRCSLPIFDGKQIAETVSKLAVAS